MEKRPKIIFKAEISDAGHKHWQPYLVYLGKKMPLSPYKSIIVRSLLSKNGFNLKKVEYKIAGLKAQRRTAAIAPRQKAEIIGINSNVLKVTLSILRKDVKNFFGDLLVIPKVKQGVGIDGLRIWIKSELEAFRKTFSNLGSGVVIIKDEELRHRVFFDGSEILPVVGGGLPPASCFIIKQADTKRGFQPDPLGHKKSFVEITSRSVETKANRSIRIHRINQCLEPAGLALVKSRTSTGGVVYRLKPLTPETMSRHRIYEELRL